jgi:hypothetical protein
MLELIFAIKEFKSVVIDITSRPFCFAISAKAMTDLVAPEPEPIIIKSPDPAFGKLTSPKKKHFKFK